MSYIGDNISQSQQAVIDGLRDQVSCGITIIGNRLTMRWHQDGELVDVHAVILDVTTVAEAEERGRVSERYQELYRKYPGLEAELYYANEGEWPK